MELWREKKTGTLRNNQSMLLKDSSFNMRYILVWKIKIDTFFYRIMKFATILLFVVESKKIKGKKITNSQ